MNKPTRGGKREGAGRKPSSFVLYFKKFRATDEEWEKFLSLLTGDSRKDFLVILKALRKNK